MRRLRLLPLLTALGLQAAGCLAGDRPPDAVYRAFVRAVAERDAEAAWGMLSASTRAWMEERDRAAAARAPGVVAAAGPRLLLGDAAGSARPVKEIEILSQDAARAVLRVVDAGGAGAEVALVREGGAWRVVIPPPPRPGG